MEDKKWTILKSEYLFRRPWLTARRDHVRFPDGRENPEYYVLEYPDWVNVIAITNDGQFVMERQYRHALGRTSYELPCGVMEPWPRAWRKSPNRILMTRKNSRCICFPGKRYGNC